MDIEYLKKVVEGALLAAGAPLSLNQLNALFPDDEKPGHGSLKEALAALDADLEGRAVELKEVGSGYRLQIRTQLMPVIAQLWSEKPPRYSRALLETLAIIAYRQPITRGEIEQIRGVSLSANILRTLQERDWIKVVGHRDVPGRPELLGTSKAFLDYFNLKSLDELPTLAEIKDLDNLEPELELIHPNPPAERTDDKEQDDDSQAVDSPESGPQEDQPEEEDLPPGSQPARSAGEPADSDSAPDIEQEDREPSQSAGSQEEAEPEDEPADDERDAR
jgi:segregation and condensation protein B